MKNRIIGLDMLRVFAMLGIIGLHVMNQGGIISNSNLYSLDYFVYLLIITCFYTSVNIFGLLSGYLNIEKVNIKYKRLIELILILFFWSFVITFAFYKFNLYGFKSFNFIEKVLCLIPPIGGKYWYITSYILVFLLMPYINISFNNLERKNAKKLLIVLFILFCVIQNLLGDIDLFRIMYGYSPFWLIYLYLIGGYIKKYNIELNQKKNILLLIVSLLSACIFNYVLKIVQISILGSVIKSDIFIDYVSPFTLFSSILLLILFKNIKCEILSKIFIYFSNMSFSVYIIHCHYLIFSYPLSGAFSFLTNKNILSSVVFLFLLLIIVYIICCILDEFRKLIFKLLKVDKLIEFLGNKLDLILHL